jgi:hypothetical protein
MTEERKRNRYMTEERKRNRYMTEERKRKRDKRNKKEKERETKDFCVTVRFVFGQESLHSNLESRVARWYICIPKIPIVYIFVMENYGIF